MPLRIGLLSIALVLVCTSVESAEWKLIGPSGAGGKDYYGFYDELTTERRIIGHVSAWVKLLSRREADAVPIDAVPDKGNKKLEDLVAEKVARYYIPPFISVLPDTSSIDYIINIIYLEVIANDSHLPTKLLIHYEIDCRQRRMKILKATRYDDKHEHEGHSSSSTEGTWDDIGPETFGDYMMKILCLPRPN